VAAAHGPVRAALFDLQTRFAARSEGAVLDGRDIATVIAPSADVKFWVDADIEERARRRWRELVALGEAVGLDAVTAQLRERDARDAGRASAPMRISPDAVRIDTTTLGPDAVFERARATLAHRGFVPPSAP
jgi:cytidylate kinase